MTTAPLDLPDAWSASTERHMLATALRAGGMTMDEAAGWLTAKPCVPMLDYLDEVLLWTNAFTSMSEARAWYDTMIPRNEAEAWAGAGYAADQADRIEAECFLALMAGRLVAPAKEWRASGLSAQWIVVCISVGVGNPRDAASLLQARP